MKLKIKDERLFKQGFSDLVQILYDIEQDPKRTAPCECCFMEHEDGDPCDCCFYDHHDIGRFIDIRVSDHIGTICAYNFKELTENTDYLFGFFVALSEFINYVVGGCFVQIKIRSLTSVDEHILYEHYDEDVEYVKDKLNYNLSGSMLDTLNQLKKILGPELDCCYTFKYFHALYRPLL